MTYEETRNQLRSVGRRWTGQGVAMELGCWLGSTSIALLEGLVEVGYDYPFWAFDKWVTTKAQVIKAEKQGVKIREKEDLRLRYQRNVGRVYPNVETIQGMIPDTLKQFPVQPIEICVFDAPKIDPTYGNTARLLIPMFIPEVTIWCQLDYFFYTRKAGSVRVETLTPLRFMDKYKEYFELVWEYPSVPEGGAFFKYIKKIPEDALDSK